MSVTVLYKKTQKIEVAQSASEVREAQRKARLAYWAEHRPAQQGSCREPTYQEEDKGWFRGEPEHCWKAYRQHQWR